jgi:hypothetical protein
MAKNKENNTMAKNKEVNTMTKNKEDNTMTDLRLLVTSLVSLKVSFVTLFLWKIVEA